VFISEAATARSHKSWTESRIRMGKL